MDQNSETVIRDGTANPAPLGLMAFGMTTVLLNLANAGLYPLDTMIMSMGLFYGGMAQIIAGIMEWRKGNTFGATAFLSYGAFWLTLVFLLLLPKFGVQLAPQGAAMASYFILWGLFTLVMFIGTLRINWKLQIVFGSLTVLYVLLAIQDILTDANAAMIVGRIAGVEGILCGLSAIYAGLSQVLGELPKRTQTA